MLSGGYEDIIIPAAGYIIEAIKCEHDLSGLAAYINEMYQAVLREDALCMRI